MYPEVVKGTPEVVKGTPEVVKGTPEVVKGTPEVMKGTPVWTGEWHYVEPIKYQWGFVQHYFGDDSM